MSYLVRKRKKREEGFTLIELVIVIAIIGILMAIAIPNYMSARQNAAVNATKANLKNLATAMELHMAENNVYPTTEDDLESYFGGSLPKTPKDKDYIYELKEDTFLIYDPDPYPGTDGTYYGVGPGGTIKEGASITEIGGTEPTT
ncbi:MAG TPA: type II secretion system protein [Candidatus Atribacteria bacterium]|nr:type II secretion system protein [Candidatus Atribacteria bacterium]